MTSTLGHKLHHPASRLLGLLLAVILAALPWAVSGHCRAQQAPEYHIKAVFLFNLTHFVNWPPQPGRAGTPFVIGIYGPDPFGGALEAAVAGEHKGHRSLRIRRFSSLDQLRSHPCDMLFVSAAAMAAWPRIRRLLDADPVLTVSDVAGFPEQGGMVNLLKIRENIQVEINRTATLQAGLHVSAKLLDLARIIDDETDANSTPQL